MSFSQRVGAFCWVAAFPVFLLANVVVGLGWGDPAFSWSVNNISDLGNVSCGVWDTSRPRYVCSPWHDVMNVAFVVTALLVIAGLVIHRPVPRAGRWLMVLGAGGLGLAGVFPADVNENVHVLGAVLVFVCGNAGLVVIGCSRRAPFRVAALVLGLLGVVAAGLFLGQQGVGLGLGWLERVTVFALPVWAFVAGCGLVLSRRVSSRGGVTRVARG